MADVDTRVETLEDEIKVLKGEVRRTLVDLRALLMREDSPLNEGSFGRRAALLEGDEEPQVTKREISDVVRQESSDQVLPAIQQVPQQSPGSGASPLPPASPNAGMGYAAPGVGVPAPFVAPPAAMPPIQQPQIIQSPMWAAGAGIPPGPPPIGPSADPAIGERERKLAEQERRMEEQERRLAEQERRIERASRANSPPIRDVNTAMDNDEAVAEAPSPVTASVEQKPIRREEEWDDEPRELDISRSTGSHQVAIEDNGAEMPRLIPPEKSDRFAEAAPVFSEENNREFEDRSRPANPRRKNSRAMDDEESGIPRPLTQAGTHPMRYQLTVEERLDEETTEYSASRRRAVRPKGRQRNGASAVHEHYDGDEGPAADVTSSGNGSRVYAEYMDLLGDIEALTSEVDANEDLLALDVNLLSSLTRWASVSKLRVGEQRLKELIDLYARSGHLPGRLRDLLQQISDMVVAAPRETSEDTQGCVDLIFHLHGILAGGLAIRRIPALKVTS